jgi:hypothetical protein
VGGRAWARVVFAFKVRWAVQLGAVWSGEWFEPRCVRASTLSDEGSASN